MDDASGPADSCADDDAHQTLRRVREVEQAAPDGRLPLPSYVAWPSFPYEGDLRVRRLEEWRDDLQRVAAELDRG